MTLEELRERRCELQRHLEDVIGSAVEKFQEDTGFSVHNIDCRFIDITTWDEARSRYLLGRVLVDLEDI